MDGKCQGNSGNPGDLRQQKGQRAPDRADKATE